MSYLFYCHGDNGSMLQAFTQALGEDELIQWLPDQSFDKAAVHAAIVWMPPEHFFDGLDNLEYVFALAAGVDQLIEHPGLRSEVTLVRLQDAGMGIQMAEYVLYGVLHAQRQFGLFRQQQADRNWTRGTGICPASEFPVSILGAGVLGLQVAARLHDNGYPVRCWSRTARQLPPGIIGEVGEQGLPSLLANSRVLVCLLPLTDETTGLLNSSLFGQLPRGAFLINVARGAHLVDEDLLAALDNQQLSGALLDVFHTEPLPPEHPFWNHPQILVTPHEAANSDVKHSVEQVVRSIRQLQRGEVPVGVVDRTRGY